FSFSATAFTAFLTAPERSLMPIEAGRFMRTLLSVHTGSAIARDGVTRVSDLQRAFSPGALAFKFPTGVTRISVFSYNRRLQLTSLRFSHCLSAPHFTSAPSPCAAA